MSEHYASFSYEQYVDPKILEVISKAIMLNNKMKSKHKIDIHSAPGGQGRPFYDIFSKS